MGISWASLATCKFVWWYGFVVGTICYFIASARYVFGISRIFYYFCYGFGGFFVVFVVCRVSWFGGDVDGYVSGF